MDMAAGGAVGRAHRLVTTYGTGGSGARMPYQARVQGESLGWWLVQCRLVVRGLSRECTWERLCLTALEAGPIDWHAPSWA
jgi:hypothetical protein